MRNTHSWYADLLPELNATGQLPDSMTPKEFFAVELGLFFLTQHYPSEQVGALWPLMSRYAACRPGEEPALQTLRTLMDKVGRSNYFLLCLDRYARISPELRGFKRIDEPNRRVNGRSRFEQQEPSLLHLRWDAFTDALSAPAPYVANTQNKVAEAGRVYEFVTSGQRTESVQIPRIANLPDAPDPLVATTTRTRQAATIHRDELRETAAWIDKKLLDTPGATPGNYAWLWDHRITDCEFIPGTADFVTKPEYLVIDGLQHEVGLMNSGKSTKALILTVNRVHAGWHVTIVVESVMKAYETVRRLRQLDINAVPLVGQSGRERHAAAYWQSTMSSSETTFPTGQDPAAVFANATCLLDPFRYTVTAEQAPLAPDDFPCRGKLRAPQPDGTKSAAADCPLLSICPHQAAARDVASAQVWVTTAQALVSSKAMPATQSMRWLEACQMRTDLMIVDEADRVQKVFDDLFVHSEMLVAAERGWANTTHIRSQQALSRLDYIPMQIDEVKDFCRMSSQLVEAVYELYSIIVDKEPASERLRETLDKNPFTGFSLLRRMTWALFGLPYGETVDSDAERIAEEFFDEHLEDLALRPLDRPPEELSAVSDAVLGPHRQPEDLATLDTWLLNHAPAERQAAVKADLAYLRVLFQCAFWSSRITTLFLQMSNLYPAVAPHLEMPDEESFWRGQPPSDYQPLVPEALMGNLMSLQWTRKGDGFTGDLRLMWVRGVGRWLIHHLHDLLETDGIQGPHVLLTSATSWMPQSSLYNVDIRPTRFLLTPDSDLEALNSSTMRFLPVVDNDYPVFVSGRLGEERNEALRQVTSSLLRPRKTKPPLLDELRQSLAPGRHQVLFVTLSGDDAERAAAYVHERTEYTACHVIPNDLPPGEYGLHLRDIHTFGSRDDDILVAAELAVQRGHNILNATNQAALGAVFYLVRPHPPASDLSFPLSMVNRAAMKSLLNSLRPAEGELAQTAQALRQGLRRGWHEQLGTQVILRRLRGYAHQAFVANAFISIYQTIGRTIRGGTATRVYFCDAAFAPRNSVQQGPRDTANTSLLVAIQKQLTTMLAPPREDATLEQQRDHVINTTLYRLAHQMFDTIQWPHSRQDS